MLRRFDADFPRVNIVIISKSSQDPLVDLGRARAGYAWQRDPLPIALGDEHCAFRQPMLDALNKAGRACRIVSASEGSTVGHAVAAAVICA